MGLTSNSMGTSLLSDKDKKKHTDGSALIALAGSPNVGKSTVFNALTGLNQHTGNWTGKTVSTAAGQIRHGDGTYLLADIPGTYSLSVRSEEERVARDFILFGGCDGIIVVCDALCLERNLSLVLQIAEYTPNLTVCVNLMDQAEKKGISYDLQRMSDMLGVSVIPCSAGKKKGLDVLMEKTSEMLEKDVLPSLRIDYPAVFENALQILEKALFSLENDRINPRYGNKDADRGKRAC